MLNEFINLENVKNKKIESTVDLILKAEALTGLMLIRFGNGSVW